MNKFETNFMLHGADYNYEQWLDYPEVLAQDMALMKASHCTVMSVGIFSWAMLEPAEGDYQFGWLDRLMDSLAENGLMANLATPSGANPNWMSKKYPEIRVVDVNGRRQPHHLRHNHCPTSPIYRQKTAQINTKLAERYKDHPALLMWHVSNEFGHYNCRCALCLQAFQAWLKERYGDLDTLNHAWWTTFWSHRYTDWSQIEPVDPSVHALMLDWNRFVSHQVLDFYLAETKPLREIAPDVPVTTNFMRPDVGLDYWQFAPHVDVICWDSYPEWHSIDGDSEMDTAVETSFYHDLNRSFKQRPFLLMESTPSMVNWQGISRQKRPGLHQLASIQSVAHGSNGVQYFQWRQSRGGSEKFHGAVVTHANHGDTRTFREVTAVGKTLTQLQPILDSVNKAEVAIIYDFQNEWAINLAELPRSKEKNYQKRCIAHYAPLWQNGITVDIINSDFDDLSNYKLVIAPMLYLLPAALAEKLQQFVKNGGTLVTTYLSGVVNESDLVFRRGAPGPLREALGLWVEETDVLFDHHSQSVRFEDGPLDDRSYTVQQMADVVRLEGARPLAVYEQDFYAGSPAVTQNAFGKGQAFYVAARHSASFLADFYGWLTKELGVKTAVSKLPTGTTAQLRQSDDGDFLFLLNFNHHAATITLDQSYRDMETNQSVCGDIDLPEYGFRILQKQ